MNPLSSRLKRFESERGFDGTELGDYSEDEAVQCKGCGMRHYLRGFAETVPWKFDDEDCTSVSVYCYSKVQWYSYRYMEDILLVSGKIVAELLEDKILELEERIHSLELKTQEPADTRSIKELKDENESTFTEALEARKQKEKTSSGQED